VALSLPDASLSAWCYQNAQYVVAAGTDPAPVGATDRHYSSAGAGSGCCRSHHVLELACLVERLIVDAAIQRERFLDECPRVPPVTAAIPQRLGQERLRARQLVSSIWIDEDERRRGYKR
jgi:hypothetical protein